ncbi:MAG: lytic murein transglycosylase [Parcubacteria group bacterium]
MFMKSNIIRYSVGFAIALVLCLVFVLGMDQATASTQSEIDERNQQIAEIERQIAAYQQQIQLNQGKSVTLSGEIARLNATISKIQLEIQSLNLAIDQTGDEIVITEGAISEAQKEIEAHKIALASTLRIMYELDQQNLTQILLQHEHLSDFFGDLNDITESQDNLRISIQSIKEAKIRYENEYEELEGKKNELETLLNIQASQRNNLNQNKWAKDSLLKETKGEEAKYQSLVTEKKRDIEAIREQITFLLQNGLSLDEAIAQAQLAAIRAGIRPEFLLGVLEVETRIGKYQGTGNWNDDMYQCYLRLGDIYYPHKKDYYHKRAENEKNAFFTIINELGLDPNSVKVSAEPAYGCGGAMGPAQFIPTTWMGYRDRVAQLTGHNPPDPWNIEDAFTAAAIKLASAGATAKTYASEIGAAKAYVGGSTTCSSNICNYYANLVQEKAAIIGANL